MLIETEKGNVVLFYMNRKYYPDDVLPDGVVANEYVRGLTLDPSREALRERFLNSTRRRSTGPPRRKEPWKVTVGVRASVVVKQKVQAMADREGITFCAMASKLLEEAVNHRETEGGAE